MAKITANGDEAARTWRDVDGCKLVWTKKGRLLRNYLKGDSLTIVRKGVQEDTAEAYARALGFERERGR